jgi:hypothetical protein
MRSRGERAMMRSSSIPRWGCQNPCCIVYNTCAILVCYWTAEMHCSLLTSVCGCIGLYTFTVCSLKCSNMWGVSSLAQHPSLVGTVQKSICKDPHISAYFNQCGLVLLDVHAPSHTLLLTSINEHFTPTQTTAVCPITHLSHACMITPISGSFAQELPPSHQLENVLCTGNCGGCDNSIRMIPHWLDSLGFEPKWGSDFTAPIQTGHWRPTQPPARPIRSLSGVFVCVYVRSQSIHCMVMTTYTHPVPRLEKGKSYASMPPLCLHGML